MCGGAGRWPRPRGFGGAPPPPAELRSSPALAARGTPGRGAVSVGGAGAGLGGRGVAGAARGKIRDDLLKLEHFLARRGELKGEAVVFDLTDPSVLVKPVAVRPLPSKGRGVQADVGAE